MERRSFLRLCGLGTCATLTGAILLPGCAGIPHVQATPIDGVVRIPRNAFIEERKGEQVMSRSLIVEAPGLQAPIVVFRNGDQDHVALLMRCTHRGTELNVTGDQLSCPAHGSAFSGTGTVLEGPATDPLKRYPVTYADEYLLITLA
jgi:Rieske Fe-S protein